MKSIRQKAVDVRNLKLSPEEGFVLSRIEGTTTVRDLVALTGLEEDRIVGIVARLRDQGAVEVEAPSKSEVDAKDDVDTIDAAEPGSESPLELEEAEQAPLIEDEQREARTYRQIYETVYRPLLRDQRIEAAHAVTGADLLALCFDGHPQVIYAVLENSSAGLDHARMIALHHRTHVGLESVAQRSDFLNDALVQHRLLRNPQLSGSILNRIVNPKRLTDVYKICIGRELPERSRVMTRDLLRKKFMLASSDEKAGLLFETEGRCLVLLVNCSLDAHATQILCSKQTFTILFIQNLARWSATPPALLTHLLKMQVVRRSSGLKKMVIKHPNVPSEVKRNFQA